MRKYIMPVIITLFGLLWLLDVKGIIPPLNILWTLALFGIGVSTLASSGVNKQSFPWGAFFIVTGLCSVARQMDKLPLRVEIPLLVMLTGVILFINQSSLIPPAGPKPPKPGA
jgi:hypothetical protein